MPKCENCDEIVEEVFSVYATCVGKDSEAEAILLVCQKCFDDLGFSPCDKCGNKYHLRVEGNKGCICESCVNKMIGEEQ